MLKLPDLAPSRCVYLSACGDVETKDKTVTKWLKKHPFVSAKAKSLYIATLGSSEEGKHFHIDVFNLKFASSEPPDPNGKISDFNSIFKKLDGCTINVELDAVFLLPLTDLPAIIKKCLLTTKSGGVSLKVTSGVLSVTGAPINRISWWLREDSDDACIRMVSRTTKTISETYLYDGYKTLESAFTAFATVQPTAARR